MKTKTVNRRDRLTACLKERQRVADELQNDVNQTLASVLLWMQFTKKEHQLQDDKAFMQAEINLKAAIDRLRTLHYSLTDDLPVLST